MPWVRFDDQFPIHRKVGGLSDAAYRLHSEAIFWCARNLTDGRIARDELAQVSGIARADRHVIVLVDRELWHEADHRCDSRDCSPVPEGFDGWVIHDYLFFQPSRQKVLAERERKAVAGRKGGIASGKSRRSQGVRSKREADGKQGASRLVEPPYPPPSSKGGAGDARRSHCGAARPPLLYHPFEPDDAGTCSVCEMPESNRRHRDVS